MLAEHRLRFKGQAAALNTQGTHRGKPIQRIGRGPLRSREKRGGISGRNKDYREPFGSATQAAVRGKRSATGKTSCRRFQSVTRTWEGPARPRLSRETALKRPRPGSATTKGSPSGTSTKITSRQVHGLPRRGIQAEHTVCRRNQVRVLRKKGSPWEHTG